MHLITWPLCAVAEKSAVAGKPDDPERRCNEDIFGERDPGGARGHAKQEGHNGHPDLRLPAFSRSVIPALDSPILF